MTDFLRRAVLMVLKQSNKPVSREVVFNKISMHFRNATEEQVWGVMVELSFEGLVKVDYQPTVEITEAGRNADEHI